jgi:hypothetical protein
MIQFEPFNLISPVSRVSIAQLPDYQAFAK